MSAIPCKRPKVTIDPRPRGDSFDVTCHVPGCGFTYPADKQFHALKVDATDTARRHRGEHRDAVPTITFTKGSYGFAVHVTCSCGKRDGRSTRTDAQAWVDHHLSSDHGLVTA